MKMVKYCYYSAESSSWSLDNYGSEYFLNFDLSMINNDAFSAINYYDLFSALNNKDYGYSIWR